LAFEPKVAVSVSTKHIAFVSSNYLESGRVCLYDHDFHFMVY